MNTIRTFWREFQIFYYSLALQSLCSGNPNHPDVPEIVVEINRLTAERISSHAR